MKKIVLFKNGVETLSYFSLELAKAFLKNGHEVYVFDLLDEELSLPQLISFYESRNTVLITFNFTGIRGEDVFLDENNHLFWNVLKIPCINIVVDHPFYYHELLANRPILYHQISIDRLHEAYMKRFFPEVSSLGFLPLGGTEIKSPSFPIHYEERTIPILFTGNYTPPSTFEKHIMRQGDDYALFYRSIIECLIKEPQHSMEEVFENFLKRELGNLSEEDLKQCMANMIFIDLYVRFYFRGEVVKTLVDYGYPVHVFGSGWNYLDCNHPENLVYEGSLDSKGCLEKMQNAKISLNVMPWFKDGAHDRIFNSMLNGSLCLTDESLYLKESFTDQKNICFYSLSKLHHLPSIVDALLKNPTTMKSITEAGYNKSKELHTWNKRAQFLESVILHNA
ncbi:MAG: glycosyltransferase [Velocimicrobium sp.]